jgi:prepilin-type processing-associated H-X9-DG protein
MPLPHPPSHRGWTWPEVIAILVVIAIVVELLGPKVLGAREANRRTQCRHNLKQLGLALHNYHDSLSTFPPGFVIDPQGTYHGWGWGTFSLPYIDASPVYFQVMTEAADGLASSPQYRDYSSPAPVFRCPSSTGPLHLKHQLVVTSPVTDGIVTPATLDVPNHFARSNYFGVVGYLHAEVGGIAYDASGEPAGQPPLVNAGSLGNIGTTFSVGHRYCDPANFRGVFGQNSWTKIADITDGTSNTLIVGERYTPKQDGPQAVGHGTWVGVPDCSTAAGLAMALGDTAVKLNAGAKTRAETTGFGSAHTGGGHFLFADGAVRFIANDVGINVYRDLSTIADGRGNFCDDF